MKPFGLGDLVHHLFRPLVIFIDLVWNTDLRDCEVCKERRRRWNALFAVPRWIAGVLLVVTTGVLLFWWAA